MQSLRLHREIVRVSAGKVVSGFVGPFGDVFRV